MNMLQISGPRDLIVACWRAACETAGALAPAHIAEALLRDVGLIDAVKEGTRAAYLASPDDRPSPRGCSVRIANGEERAIEWISDTHQIALFPLGDNWLLQIESIIDHSNRMVAAVSKWIELVEATRTEDELTAIQSWLDENPGNLLAAADEPGVFATVWLPAPNPPCQVWAVRPSSVT